MVEPSGSPPWDTARPAGRKASPPQANSVRGLGTPRPRPTWSARQASAPTNLQGEHQLPPRGGSLWVTSQPFEGGPGFRSSAACLGPAPFLESPLAFPLSAGIQVPSRRGRLGWGPSALTPGVSAGPRRPPRRPWGGQPNLRVKTGGFRVDSQAGGLVLCRQPARPLTRRPRTGLELVESSGLPCGVPGRPGSLLQRGSLGSP